MNSAYQFDASRPFEMVDKVVDQWSRVMVPVFMKDEHSAHRVKVIGSAFLAGLDGDSYLVTARHVLDGLPHGEALLGLVLGKGVVLNGLFFVVSKAEDLAIAKLTLPWVIREGLAELESLPYLPLVPAKREGTSLGVFVLMGYPGSKNRLNGSTGDTDRRLVAYSSTDRIEQPKSQTHVQTPVAFRFDKKEAKDTDQNKVDVGTFNGNSGGPVLEISGTANGTENTALYASLAGVFVGWDKVEKELVCARPEALVELVALLKSKGL